MDNDKKGILKDKKLLYYFIVAFVVSSAIFISFFIISNFDTIVVYGAGIINTLIKALTPLTIGIVLAYLFNRPVLFFEKFFKKVKSKREISIGILYILIAGVITLIINFVVPGIQKNLIQLSNIDISGYSSMISSKYQDFMDKLQSLGFSIDYNSIQNQMSIQKYISQFTTLSAALMDGVMGFIKGLTKGIFNFILSMVLAFYLLQKKEKLLGSIKELIYLYGPKKINGHIIDELKEFNTILNGYISGVLMDAMIVCVLVTIGLKIVGHNYFLLMGVLIGVLNLIPYFGSIIGCAVAVLLAAFQGAPKAITTLIVLIVIQQIDGNVIQPRIVGNKVGLEPLWVIIAILVFGSYWGLPGMILAVPFMALIKTIIKRLVDKRRASTAK